MVAPPAAPVAQPDPDLHRPPPTRVLSIDWAQVNLTTEADALALWQRIAPTGFDWQDKLMELPPPVERPLAIALLRGGAFTCMTPAPRRDCAPALFDVVEPTHAAGFTDPCLRRLLALWAIEQLEPEDLAGVRDALRAIAAIPPPESELVAAALDVLPEADHAGRLELLAIAWRAGQRDVVHAAVGKLDEAHLIEAASQHHIDGALEVLSADGHRAIYLGAVTDEALATRSRTQAMFDLIAVDDKLPPELKRALVIAATSKDCSVAAAAARILAKRGDRRFVPKRARTPAPMMRSLCVLASYEQQQQADEASLLPGFVRTQGLERVTITYDALGETDPDGDGDPHTARAIDLLTRDAVVLPELDELVRAMTRCAGTTCRTDGYEFRFGLERSRGELRLARIEVIERPPCPRP
ncbi:MAG: hypothetical protein H0X17_09990 [Deltaproteobacteria bacterium]|nr:hypothetical protein [Deltaproteobacteria bacterium]